MTHDRSNIRPKIALYEPDIPQNTASIIRTCSCLDAYLEIIEPCGFLFSDKRFKRVVMDYMDEDKIQFYKNSEEFFDSKKNDRVILITTKSKKSYTDFNYSANDTILFGRESAGVPEHIHKLVNERLKIPMIKNKRSLNISTSVAIVLAENLRQINEI
ncbi:MAG: tRNA methyltransferase [Candidatus Pelagibacter sp.]|nr:MAG: tRNA methyltransferase [Candidatus Pelagibacter sp.]HIC11478.1 tRNA (cytidine(34)-2'-O)-methyltransferase [Candidatus Pelagibacter sp.]